VRCLPTASALPLKKDFGTSRLAALVSSYTTCPCVRRAEEHSHRDDTYHLDPRRNDPARPMGGIRARMAHGGDDNGVLGTLQLLDLLIKLSDARSRSGIQRVAERPLSSRDRPSFAAVATAGMCQEPTFSPIGIYGISAGRSFRLDSGLFNNWAPLLRFGRKQPGEFCRGGRSDWGANRFVPLLNG
jgi:hypothetical protein